MTENAPGPWEVRETALGVSIARVGERHAFATLGSRPNMDVARLIAAAPDLLAVAQDWLNVMEYDDAECSCAPGDVCPLCRCKAALKKAGVLP